MVRLRGRSSRARGTRRGIGGRGATGRGGIARGSRGAGRGARGSFSAPIMGRPRPPALPPMGFGEPDYGYAGPRMPPMMPPPIPGPRSMRPYPPPPALHPAAPFPRARPFPNDYPIRHPMGMPQLPPRPMLPPVPLVPPFIRGRGGFRGGLGKSGKAFNNGAVSKGKANKKKSAKAKRNEENDPFYCEACNRSWKTAEELQKHISEHEVCGREGCTFTAHPKIVALHVQFHHYTGMYKKIANVQSPEDIAKWIAERKSRYPTDANIAVRMAKEKEMIERGERVEENKTDRNNRQRRGEQKSNRLSWREKRLRRDQAMAENKPVNRRSEMVSDEEEDESPKKDWNGNLPPFQGLSCLSTINEVDTNIKMEENPSGLDISGGSISSLSSDSNEYVCSAAAVLADSTGVVASVSSQEDKSLNEDKSKSKPTGADSNSSHSPMIMNNATSGHNPVYDAEPKKTASAPPPTSEFNSPCAVKLRLVPYDIDANEESDDSGPEECPFTKTTEENVNTPSEVPVDKVTEADPPMIINSSETNDSVKNPKSRKRQRHRSSLDKGKDSEQDSVKKENFVKKRKLTLLEKLLSKEIQHERNVILQCVHYVVSNNFFNDDKISNLWMDDSDSDSSTD